MKLSSDKFDSVRQSLKGTSYNMSVISSKDSSKVSHKKSLNTTEHHEKNPFKKHLSIMLPTPSLHTKKKIKKPKKKIVSGEISSCNDSPKPEI